MSKLEQVSTLISSLTPQKRAQILAQIVEMMNVTELGIRHTPGVCGGRARIRDTRIPVWTIVEAKNAGASDLDILSDFPSLTAEDITNALRYYQGHQAEIEQDLKQQEQTAATPHDKAPKYTPLQNKLLNGPVMANEDYELYLEKKKHFDQQ